MRTSTPRCKARLSQGHGFWMWWRWEASNPNPWDFWRIYSSLLTDLTLCVWSRLPAPLTWRRVLWSQGATVNQDLQTFPDWVSKSDAAPSSHAPCVRGIMAGRGISLGSDCRLYCHYSCSTQLLSPPTASRTPSLHCKWEAPWGKLNSFSSPNKAADTVLCFPSFHVCESPGNLITM